MPSTHLSPDVVDHLELAVIVESHVSGYSSEVEAVGGFHVLEGEMNIGGGALTEETVGGA